MRLVKGNIFWIDAIEFHIHHAFGLVRLSILNPQSSILHPELPEADDMDLRQLADMDVADRATDPTTLPATDAA